MSENLKKENSSLNVASICDETPTESLSNVARTEVEPMRLHDYSSEMSDLAIWDSFTVTSEKKVSTESEQLSNTDDIESQDDTSKLSEVSTTQTAENNIKMFPTELFALKVQDEPKRDSTQIIETGITIIPPEMSTVEQVESELNTTQTVETDIKIIHPEMSAVEEVELKFNSSQTLETAIMIILEEMSTAEKQVEPKLNITQTLENISMINPGEVPTQISSTDMDMESQFNTTQVMIKEEISAVSGELDNTKVVEFELDSTNVQMSAVEEPDAVNLNTSQTLENSIREETTVDEQMRTADVESLDNTIIVIVNSAEMGKREVIDLSNINEDKSMFNTYEDSSKILEKESFELGPEFCLSLGDIWRVPPHIETSAVEVSEKNSFPNVVSDTCDQMNSGEYFKENIDIKAKTFLDDEDRGDFSSKSVSDLKCEVQSIEGENKTEESQDSEETEEFSTMNESESACCLSAIEKTKLKFQNSLSYYSPSRLSLANAFENLKINVSAEDTFLSCDDLEPSLIKEDTPQVNDDIISFDEAAQVQVSTTTAENDGQTSDYSPDTTFSAGVPGAIGDPVILENQETFLPRPSKRRESAGYIMTSIPLTLTPSPVKQKQAQLDNAFYTKLFSGSPSVLNQRLANEHKEYVDLKLDINNLKQTIAKLTMEIGQKEEQILKLRPNSVKIGPTIKSTVSSLSNDRIAALQAESIIALETERNEYHIEIEELRHVLENKNKEITQLEEQLRNSEKELQEVKEVNAALNINFMETDDLLAQYAAKTTKLETQYKNLNIAFEQIVEKYEKTKQVALGLKSNEQTYLKTIEKLTSQMNEYKENYEHLKQNAEKQISEANKENERMRTEAETKSFGQKRRT